MEVVSVQTDQTPVTPLPSAQIAPLPAPEHPRGNFSVKVDDKGRLKLPPPFLKYLAGLEEKVVFVTTTDEETARIYPRSKWKEAEKWLTAEERDPVAVERMWFLAYHWGQDSEVDEQGRILLPTELRRELNLTKEPVWICPQRTGRFDVLTKAMYEEKLKAARAYKAPDNDMAKMQKMP